MFIPTQGLKILFILLFCFSFSSTEAQTITTVAGGMGNDTLAVPYARLHGPEFISVDPANNLYVGDKYNSIFGYSGSYATFRKLNIATGILSPVNGGGRGVFDAAGNWYYVNESDNKVYRRSSVGVISHIAGNGSYTYSGDGSIATMAGMRPSDVAVDAHGNVYVCDKGNRRIRKVNSSGIISTIAGGGTTLGNGGPALLAYLSNPITIAADTAGNIYINDNENRIRKVNTSGIIDIYAGNGSSNPLGEGGQATSAGLSGIKAIKIDGAGNLYLALSGHRIRKINTSGIINTIAGTGTSGFTGDGGAATAARINNSNDMAVDIAGNVYIVDEYNGRVRKIDAGGNINTILGNGIAINGFSGDGGAALMAAFRNYLPSVLADGMGNVYIADATNQRIRKVNSAGIVSTFAGNGTAGYYGDGGPASAAALSIPVGLALDKMGNLYIGEAGSNHVRKVNTSGIISTVAGGGSSILGDGGPATAAAISVIGIAVDTNGNIFIADSANKRIRKVDGSTGIITTIAGNGSSIHSGDGGPATAAGLYFIKGLYADKRGNIYVTGGATRKINVAGIISSLPISSTSITADTMGNLYFATNNTIRRLDIYNYLSVIAGTGMGGYSGDNGPAAAAQLTAGFGLAPDNGISVDTFGQLYFTNVNGVRKICCLSNVIDIPPVFTKGTTTSTIFCRSSVANSLDTFLKVSDGDIGNPLTWTIISNPLHGSLGGFPYSAVSTGGIVTPSGLTYTPVAGYTGSDNFKIKINDGTDTGMIQVSVNMSPPPSPPSIYGSSNVCLGDTINLTTHYGGGIWSTSNTNASVDTAGKLIGLSTGTVTISYTKHTFCGAQIATKEITVNTTPDASITTTIPTVCINASVVWSGIPSGGTWGSASSNAIADYTSGSIRGMYAGTATIKYRVTNSCGTDIDSAVIEVLPPTNAGTITGSLTGCPNDNSQLSNSVPGGIWSSGNSSIATIDGNGVLTFVSSGTTTVSYKVNGICGEGMSKVTVRALDKPDVGYISGITNGCSEEVHSLSSSVGGGMWSTDNSAVATIDSSGNLVLLTEGTTTVSYTINNNCGLGSAITTAQVKPIPILTAITGKSIIITGNTTELRGRAPSGIWSSSDSSVAVIDAWGVVTGIANGTATITYSETNSYGCSADTTLQIRVTPNTAIEFSIYPNPASRLVTIGYKKSAVKEAEIRITDYAGRAVYTSKFAMPSSAGSNQFNIFGIPDGVYTVTIKSGDGDFVGRLMIVE
jgi:hypothetical protein